MRREMKANLLVIDESTAPGALSKFLTVSGYVCHYARGPLKLRETLKANRIDLILWQDGGRNRVQSSFELDMFGHEVVVGLIL